MRRQFQRSLQKQGMAFKLSTKVNGARREGDKVVLEVAPAKGGASETMEVDVVLVSAGEGGVRCWGPADCRRVAFSDLFGGGDDVA